MNQKSIRAQNKQNVTKCMKQKGVAHNKQNVAKCMKQKGVAQMKQNVAKKGVAQMKQKVTKCMKQKGVKYLKPSRDPAEPQTKRVRWREGGVGGEGGGVST